jgi:hypothetical protein
MGHSGSIKNLHFALSPGFLAKPASHAALALEEIWSSSNS